MNKFAFLAHPTGLNNLYFILGKWANLLEKFPKSLLKRILKNISPYKLAYIKEIRSVIGKKIDGIVILYPLLPEQMVELDRELILKKIVSAGRLAQRSGAMIIGLGGFTSIFSNQGIDVAGELEIAVTTGNTYTASLVIEGILKAAELIQYTLENATVAIIGATGDIGASCAKMLTGKVKRLLLVAREQNKLLELSLSLRQNSSTQIDIVRYPNDAALQAEIIITSTSSITTLLEAGDLKNGAIVCDVSLPPNIAREVVKQRDDIFVFEGGYAKLPYFNELNDINLKKYFPFGAIFGCLAETIVLALEEKFENFSLGKGKITLESMKEIRDIGKKHGFELAPFFCGDKIYSVRDIEKIKNNR
ncbi:MAG: shikimate dehydrogenase [Candidatus Omnitrophica bacterium]|nr:shikimate dehydrogenase [Candidatus Omnitrophota bacterium]